MCLKVEKIHYYLHFLNSAAFQRFITLKIHEIIYLHHILRMREIYSLTLFRLTASEKPVFEYREETNLKALFQT